MEHELAAAAGELAAACRVLAEQGHEDKALGHLSWRDPQGRGFWLKRAGIGLSEVRGADDFVLLDFDGEELAGGGARHIEWPIHAEILRRRDDLAYAFHSHPRHAVVFSALDDQLAVIGNEGVLFVDGVPRFTATADLILNPSLGVAVAATLGDGRALFLRNHGIVTAGATLAEVVITSIYLEATAHNQLDLLATGRPFVAVEHDDAVAKRNRTCNLEVMSSFWDYYRRLDADQRGATP